MTVIEAARANGVPADITGPLLAACEHLIAAGEAVRYVTAGNVAAMPSACQWGLLVVTSHRVLFCRTVSGHAQTTHLLFRDGLMIGNFSAGTDSDFIALTNEKASFVVYADQQPLEQLQNAVEAAFHDRNDMDRIKFPRLSSR